MAAAAALLVFAASFFVSARCAAAQSGMNLVIVGMDSVRADHVGAYGYSRATTPRLDRLAAEGVLFENAFAQAPTSVPSHASLWTSLYPRSHGAYGLDRPLAAGARTLASALKARGYRTAAFTGGFSLSAVTGLDAGFTTYFDAIDRASLSDTVPRALDWLARRRSGGLFFLFVHGYDAHPPYRAPAAEQHHFDPGYRGWIDSEVIDHALTDRICGNALYEDYRCLKRLRSIDTADIEHLRAHYDGAIRHADASLGKLLDGLDRLGLTSSTIVAVLADHGELIEDHHEALSSPHGELFDDSLRVPLAVRAPGVAALRVGDDVALVDVAPTFLELLGLPALSGARGRSLLPLMRGKTLPPSPVFSQTFAAGSASPCTALRAPPWKLVRCPGREDELFDLLSDPRHLVDVKASEPQAYRELSAALDAWLQAVPRAGAPAAPSRGELATRRRLRAVAYWTLKRPDRERLDELHRAASARALELGRRTGRYLDGWGKTVVMAHLYNGIIPKDFARFFDRDPERRPPVEPRILVAPADGIVLSVEKGASVSTVTISLAMRDVHVQRIPISGRVRSMRWEGRGHLSIANPLHLGNVRRVTVLETEIGECVVTQITGIWTKRIENVVREGQEVRLGERLGRILLGSTVTLAVPARVRLTVNPYDRVWGGETILGRY